jgi:hypothetical protein
VAILLLCRIYTQFSVFWTLARRGCRGKNGGMTDDNGRIDEQLGPEGRANRREQLVSRIRKLGGYVPEPNGDISPEFELSFLAHVLAWETGTFSTHGEWLARHGFVFEPPEDLRGRRLKAELWRLIEALAVARVFLYHTNHLSDAELYTRLWNDVLDADAPDFGRTCDDGCHWDFADAGSGEEQIWLTYYASEAERHAWVREFRDVVLPACKRPPYCRDHRLPLRERS